MKATLHFDLEDSEDRKANERCIKALELCRVIYDFGEELRKIRKYDHEGYDQPTVEKFADKFYEMLNERGLSLEDLL